MFQVKAFIFDMDGVITDTMPYHFAAWKKVFKEQGIKVNYFDIYKREGQAGLASVVEILKEKKIKFTLQEAKLLLAKKEEFFKRIVKTRFVTGARPFIRFLKKQGFLLGLVTGTSRQEMERILPGHILDLFDATVTGDEVRKSKPHPEPFLKALKLLRVKPNEAVVIENAPFGIKAAKKGGLFCLALKTSLPGRFLKEADIVLNSYPEFKKFCKFLKRNKLECKSN